MALRAAKYHFSWGGQNSLVQGCSQQRLQGDPLLLSRGPLLIDVLQVVLTGEGSDDIFGGYGWLTLDYLRDSDPAAVGLGFALPTDRERLGMLAKLEASAGIPEYSTSVVSVKDSKLLKISTHHVMTTLTAFYRPMFSPKVLELTGGPEIAQCMAEGVNPLVRQHSVSGYWHSLNIASVRVPILPTNNILTTPHSMLLPNAS